MRQGMLRNLSARLQEGTESKLLDYREAMSRRDARRSSDPNESRGAGIIAKEQGRPLPAALLRASYFFNSISSAWLSVLPVISIVCVSALRQTTWPALVVNVSVFPSEDVDLSVLPASA